MPMKTSIHKALQDFATSVKVKMTQIVKGDREDQLRGPFETFMKDAATVFGLNIVCTGETPLPDRIGKPDYAILLDGLLAGYVELKAPGVGANCTKFNDNHNINQFQRFTSVPNILYTDGNEWALYRNGERVGSIVHLEGNIPTEGKKAVNSTNANSIERLLRDFLSWKPSIPCGKDGRINLEGFASLLAPLCRMLRDDVKDTLKNTNSSLAGIAKDWRMLLFPDASDEQFADAYAQTVTFALLLGRSEGADPLNVESAQKALAAEHNLLSEALHFLVHERMRSEISSSLNLLLRVIGVVPIDTLAGPESPWLYFYEDFLAVYDPGLRKDVGAYYTPVQVVRAQVRLIDDLLIRRVGKPMGFGDPGVFTLDPAVGTGTYLLGVIEHVLGRVRAEQGSGAVAGQATTLAKNLYGFECLVGPYAVSELRISCTLRDSGASLPVEGTRIYLTDTLESPDNETTWLPDILQPIAEQHKKALAVKNTVPVIVCLGNPPYDRHAAVDTESDGNLSRYGGWVRFGDPLPGNVYKDRSGRTRELRTVKARLERRQELAIFRDFREPVVAAGHGVHVKNLYNLYVYFWRWAMWKVFEHDTAEGPGIASFISASSYIDGDAFCGMREHMRRVCDEIWILDLGGEGRGTHQSENVFAIRTPVAIAVALRSNRAPTKKPARVHYAVIEGTRAEKLGVLNTIDGFAHTSLQWQDCPEDWQAPFRPAVTGDYFTWPSITDLMPWQHSGAEVKRTWPIAPGIEPLERRWRSLLGSLNSIELAKSFRETRDRKIYTKCAPLFNNDEQGAPLAELSCDAPIPRISGYAYRSFDRQLIIADTRLGDYLRPDLWRNHGQRQVYLTSLLNHPIGGGPAVTACSYVPDRHHFRGSYGGKEVFPLYRAADTLTVNILAGLLEYLGDTFKCTVTPEDFLAYIYGTLAHPDFTARFTTELQTRELRVPITRDLA